MAYVQRWTASFKECTHHRSFQHPSWNPWFPSFYTKHGNGKSPFLIGNISSSHAWLSIVMFFFRGVCPSFYIYIIRLISSYKILLHPHISTWCWTWQATSKGRIGETPSILPNILGFRISDACSDTRIHIGIPGKITSHFVPSMPKKARNQ